ncbi:MAG: hypothetical protein OEM41_08865 [Ignavibacteria bacterium]|nr:hypothetical protein [Ignavibacteria bacterium]
MKTNQKKAVLNRAVFTLRPFDSGALTVLTTLLHHFPEVGDYEAFVHRDGQHVLRLHVHVVDKDAPFQHNIDMAKPLKSDDCGCSDKADLLLNVGGILGFYASEGTAGYTVTVTQLGKKEKRTLLDSHTGIPAGDLFAVTLVRPGAYRVIDRLNKAEATVTVEMPEVPKKGEVGQRSVAARESRYRPDRPSLVKVDKGAFTPKETRIYAGQTVVFQCAVTSQIRVEMAQPEKRSEAERARKRYTAPRPPTRPEGK